MSAAGRRSRRGCSVAWCARVFGWRRCCRRRSPLRRRLEAVPHAPARPRRGRSGHGDGPARRRARRHGSASATTSWSARVTVHGSTGDGHWSGLGDPSALAPTGGEDRVDRTVLLVVVLLFVLLVDGVRGQGGADHPAGAGRGDRTARPLPAHPDARAGVPGAVHRPDPRTDRPARAGGVVPAAAGDHAGQPDGEHRHRRLLPGASTPRPRSTRSPTTSSASSRSRSRRCATWSAG